MKIPLYKRFLSYLFPITLETTIGNNMTVLLMQLYCDQFMLGTSKAIYSYGIRYNPFRKPFKLIEQELSGINTFLLLGTGLGSALKILQDQYALFPDSVLVDNDEDVLQFSIRYMQLNDRTNVQWKCSHALQYLQDNTQKFDLIGVDIFNDLVQPEFTFSDAFLMASSERLTAKGICIFNMILKDDNKIVAMEKQLKKYFSRVRFLMDKVNTYFICFVN